MKLIKYRPDIDGLRALAVLSVVAFHAFPGMIPGGFVGVDVFFVISGYLITGIIYKEITNRSFSIWDFYARRIRRIFPALIVTLSVTLSFGWLILLPEEYAQLGKHVLGGSFFYSNILLWSEAGYFDVDGKVKPLLHLWSLGVEEQYYLIWPLAVLGIWAVIGRHAKSGIIMITITVMVALTSFLLNILNISTDHTAVFYSPVTRIWELLIGSTLVLGERNGWVLHRIHIALKFPWILNVVSIGGALLIVFTALFASTQYAFPGWLALAPTIGATLVIASGPDAVFNARVFASRPAVFLGLISYPLYLLHWPLLSFIHIYEPEVYSPLFAQTNTAHIRELKVTALCLAFLAAIITHQLIEKQFKKFSPSKVANKLLPAMALLALIGAVLFFSEGLAELRGPFDGPLHSKLKQPTYLDCIKESGAIFNGAYSKKQPSCPSIGDNTKLDILVFGDSHGMDFYRGIENTKLTIGLFDANSCMPLEGFEKDNKGTCSIHLKRFDELVDILRPTKIVISLYFSRFYYWYGKEQNLNQMARNAVIKLSKSSDLIVMLDVPILAFNPDNCRSRPVKQRIDCIIPIGNYVEQRESYEKGWRDAASGLLNVKFVDPGKIFCSANTCWGAKDGVLLYRDTHHLTNEGSLILGKLFWENYFPAQF